MLRRLLCLAYEMLLLAAVGFSAALLLLALAYPAGLSIPRHVLQAYLLIVGAVYFVPQWRAGQTLPMKTWRIRLVSARGGSLTARQASLRYGFALLSWMLVGAGYLWALVDRDGQFLHDRLAGTRLTAIAR